MARSPGFLRKLWAFIRRLFRIGSARDVVNTTRLGPREVFATGCKSFFADLTETEIQALYDQWMDPNVTEFSYNGVCYGKFALSSPNTRMFVAAGLGSNPRLIKIMDGAPLNFYSRLRKVYPKLGKFVPQMHSHFVFGDSYIAEVDYVESVTLGKYVEQMKDNPNQAVLALRELAKASARWLETCHQHNILFSDVKPANFGITADGKLMMVDPKYAYIDPEYFAHCGFSKKYKAPVVNCYGRHVPVQVYPEQLSFSFAETFRDLFTLFKDKFNRPVEGTEEQPCDVGRGLVGFIEDVNERGLHKAASAYFRPVPEKRGKLKAAQSVKSIFGDQARPPETPCKRRPRRRFFGRSIQPGEMVESMPCALLTSPVNNNCIAKASPAMQRRQKPLSVVPFPQDEIDNAVDKENSVPGSHAAAVFSVPKKRAKKGVGQAANGLSGGRSTTFLR